MSATIKVPVADATAAIADIEGSHGERCLSTDNCDCLDRSARMWAAVEATIPKDAQVNFRTSNHDYGWLADTAARTGLRKSEIARQLFAYGVQHMPALPDKETS